MNSDDIEATVPKPVPTPSPETRRFHEAATEGRLLIRECPTCGRRHEPDMPKCVRCLGQETEWIEATGRGTIVSYVTYRRSYHPAFVSDIPYTVALVELEEGVRLIGNLLSPVAVEAGCGTPVDVEFEIREGQGIPQFRVRMPTNEVDGS